MTTENVYNTYSFQISFCSIVYFEACTILFGFSISALPCNIIIIHLTHIQDCMKYNMAYDDRDHSI